MIGELRHEEGLAHLRRSDEKVCTCEEQAVDDGRPALVNGLVKIVHGNGVKVAGIVHAVHLADRPKMLAHGLIICLAFAGNVCYT